MTPEQKPECHEGMRKLTKGTAGRKALKGTEDVVGLQETVRRPPS